MHPYNVGNAPKNITDELKKEIPLLPVNTRVESLYLVPSNTSELLRGISFIIRTYVRTNEGMRRRIHLVLVRTL